MDWRRLDEEKEKEKDEGSSIWERKADNGPIHTTRELALAVYSDEMGHLETWAWTWHQAVEGKNHTSRHVYPISYVRLYVSLCVL